MNWRERAGGMRSLVSLRRDARDDEDWRPDGSGEGKEPHSRRALSLEGAAAPRATMVPLLSEEAARLAVRLRAALSRSPSVVVVTGLAEGEGVSTLAAELAIGLAQGSPDPVLLLDANLRAPSLHARFERDRGPGLSDVIQKRASLHEAVACTSLLPSLFLLPAGAAVADSVATLSTADCLRVLRDLRQQFRMVVVDTSPLARCADAALLASEADGVVVVAAAGAHRRSELRGLKDELEALGARVLGVMLCEKPTGPSR